MKLFLFFSVLLFSTLLFAQAPAPTPLDTQALLNGALGVAQNWKSAGVWAGISALIYFLVSILKTGTFKNFFDKILSEKLQALFVAVLGVVAVVIGGKLAGGSLGSDLILGLQSSAGAVLGHEILSDLFPPKVDAQPAAAVAPASDKPAA